MPTPFDKDFPELARFIQGTEAAMLEQVLSPASRDEVEALERDIGVPLPSSYRRFLMCARGLWLLGGRIQMSAGHPFIHDFPDYEELTLPQRRVVSKRGGKWPPPSDGLLCFAEFFLEADGDQVLFDIRTPSENAEYRVLYYAHEVPETRVIASTFDEWVRRIPEWFEEAIRGFSDDV